MAACTTPPDVVRARICQHPDAGGVDTLDMEATTKVLGPDDLLAHVGWVRRLAGALVQGEDAHDLAQETLLAALRRPPDVDRPVRPWLGTVLGNMVRTARRGATRRRAREQQQARESARTAPSAEVML